MRDHGRLLLLILIMAAVAAIIGTSAIQIIYRGGLERERARLQDIAQSQANLLNALVSFDQAYSSYPEGAAAGSLKQFLDANASYTPRGVGRTGEMAVARRVGDSMVFLLRQNSKQPNPPQSLPMDSDLAQPMRAALSGRSGTMIGKDYAGDIVLAAHEPVPALNLGIVAKIDVAEIRQRFTDAVVPLVGIGAVAVVAAAMLFFRITEPVLKRMRRNEQRFRGLFDHMKSGAAVFEASGGGDFVLTDLNRRGEEIAAISREAVVGRPLTEVFPGVVELGFLTLLEQVQASGTAQDQPASYYRDGRMEGWRESHVYKLPTGELVSLFNDVTEQKAAERALKESEARFRSTFDNAAVGIAHVGLDGSWLLVNNRLCEIVGYSRDELMRRTFQDITHPDDLEEDVALFGRLMRGELATYTAEKRYVRGDAKMVWVSLTTAVQTDEHGRALYCISVVQDISRRKQAERTLQENENRMRAILDASGDEILLVSTQGRVLAINKAAERRLARRLASMTPVGADLAQLLPPDLAEKRSAVVSDVARLGNPIHMDLPIRAGWFEFWFYPVRHADQPISEVAIFARDISERKRAESELRRLYQAIQQSPTSVVITDPNGCIVYVNPKFCELTGYGCDEVIGQNPRVLKSGYTSADEYKTLWETITSGRVWQGEFRNRKKNGELYWEIASIAPVKNDEGKIINFVAVKEDVTERRAIEEQFRQSQKMQAIGQLTGGIAHDFNNLLTIITGNLQLLQRTAGEQAPRLLADALWAAQRGGELTHRLLAFARMQPLRPSLINLNDVVRGLTGLLARTLGPKVEVVEALDPAVPGVFADAGELERAIVNLAINARDAMPEGGRLLLQTARAVLDDDYVEHHADVVPGDYVMLAVSDSGTGISPNMLSRIFEPFFTTKPVGRGSGLGLSMVYGFLKQSGGHASVYSEVGKGTTFKLFFPQAGQSNDAPGTPTATAERDVEFEAAGRTALVVEDEERLRLVAASLLQELGFAVLEAGDGAGALRQAEAAAGLDLLFTDVELPCGMNGIAVAHGIRRLHPGARVLYTTGYSAALTPGNGHVPSDAAVLVKPYARQQLIRHLRTLFPAEGGGSR